MGCCVSKESFDERNTPIIELGSIQQLPQQQHHQMQQMPVSPQQPQVGLQPPQQPQVGLPMFNHMEHIPDQVRDFCVAHQISDYMWPYLFHLRYFNIIFVLDDSGSMCTGTEGGETRWTELKYTMGKPFKKSCLYN